MHDADAGHVLAATAGSRADIHPIAILPLVEHVIGFAPHKHANQLVRGFVINPGSRIATECIEIGDKKIGFEMLRTVAPGAYLSGIPLGYPMTKTFWSFLTDVGSQFDTGPAMVAGTGFDRRTSAQSSAVGFIVPPTISFPVKTCADGILA